MLYCQLNLVPKLIYEMIHNYCSHLLHMIVFLYVLLQVSSTLSRMRGCPWALMATCTSLMPYRKTVVRTIVALLPSPKYAPSSRKLPWLSRFRAVGLQNSIHGFNQHAVSCTPPARLFVLTSRTNSREAENQNSDKNQCSNVFILSVMCFQVFLKLYFRCSSTACQEAKACLVMFKLCKNSAMRPD